MNDLELISDYVLGELGPLDRARFERRLSEDGALRVEVEQMRALIGRLEALSGEAWDHAGASPQGLAEPLPAEPATVPSTQPSRRRRGRRFPQLLSRPAGLLAAAGAAILLIVLVVALGSGSSTDSRTVLLRALAAAPAGSRGVATVTGAQRVQLHVEHLPPVGASHYYELWLMTDTTHLRPVAAFRVDATGSARLSVTLPVAAQRYRYLNVSLQQSGAGGGISSLSLLRGPTTGS